jgi:hypothetical protein
LAWKVELHGSDVSWLTVLAEPSEYVSNLSFDIIFCSDGIFCTWQ